MTTMHSPFPPTASRSRTPLDAVRDARRWVKETPAPRWEGDATSKATFAGYVGASMVIWTVLGLSITAALGRVLELLG